MRWARGWPYLAASMQKARPAYPILPLLLIAALLAAAALASTPASAAELYTNGAPITIPDSGQASTYPSTITVSGQRSRITDVGVTLRGVTHSDAGDLDVLLVSPDGDTSIVMSDACLGGQTAANLFFNQGYPDRVPAGGPCLSGTYRPANYGASVDAFPNVPAGTHTPNLDNAVGGNPNGEWRLYVVDDNGGDSGKINGGWSLTLETADADATLPGSATSGVANPYPISRTVSAVSGVIADVDVSLGGVFHERAQDLDLLLVGPQGKTVMLMSDHCGATRAKDAVWIWDDEAPAAMSTTAACPSLSAYRPGNGFPFEVMPAPAPLSPYGSTLATFDNTDPNGEWKLYANDDLGPDGEGFFTGRFALAIKTRPKAKVKLAADAVDISEGELGYVSLERTSDGLGLGSVVVKTEPVTATSGSDFRPESTRVDFGAGQTKAEVAIQALADELPEGTETFALAISDPKGDADVGATPRAVVTIHDPAPRPEDTPGTGGGETTGGETTAGGTTTGGGAAPDRTAPVVSRLKLSRGAVSKKRGTRISFALSEPATVKLAFQRRKGRRYVTAATLQRAGRLGTNKVRFAKRIGRKALRRGTYRVLVTAVDAAGNRSVPRPRSFRVVG